MESSQPNSPGFTEQEVGAQQPPRAEDLGGMFATQDDVPATPARKLSEQIRISGGKVYVYDTSTTDWIELGAPPSVTAYSGIINPDGTAGLLPTGWSSSKIGTGQYRVTHNLGVHVIWVATLVTAPQTTVFDPSFDTGDTFDVWIKDFGGTFQDHAFNFILHLRP